MGIFESEIASSTQLKGAEIVVAGFGGLKTDNDLERVVVGIRDSVCVDIMVAEENGGMIWECV